MKMYSRTVRRFDADPIESDPFLGEDQEENEITATNIELTGENRNQYINVHIGHCALNDSSLNLPINTD